MTLLFEGLREIAKIPNRAAINNWSAFTISFWAYFTRNNLSNTPNIVIKGYPANNSFILYFTSNTYTLNFRTINNTGVGVTCVNTATTTVVPFRWYHITISMDTATGSMKLYLNAGTPTTNTNAGCVNIGTVADLNFNGSTTIKAAFLMRDLKIWNTQLSDQQVQDQYDGIGEDNIPTAAWYPLNENTGSPVDIILPVNTMNLNGGTLPVKWATLENQYKDTYLFLDGVNDFINFGAGSTLWGNAAGVTKFTFSFWIKPTVIVDGVNHREILTHAWAQTYGWDLYILKDAPVRLYMEVVDTTWPTRIFSGYVLDPFPIDDEWYLVTVSYDGNLSSNTVTMYINGVDRTVRVTNAAGKTLVNTASLYMQTSNGINEQIMGVSDFRWWNEKILSPKQVKQLYQKGRNGGNLDLYWDLVNDGTSDWVNLGNHADLWQRPLDEFSFSFFIKPDALNTGAYQYIVNHGWATNESFICFFDQSTYNIYFCIKDAGGVQRQSKYLLSAAYQDKEFNVTCVYDSKLASGNVKIYIDGVLGDLVGSYAGTPNFSTNLTLGQSAGLSYLGTIRDFKWWNKALTQAEALAETREEGITNPNYWIRFTDAASSPKDVIGGTKTAVLAGQTWIARSNPNFWCPMLEGTGSPYDIYSGNATTLTGGTWYNNEPTVTHPSFELPLSCKIKIQSNDESTTHYLYDSNGSKPFRLLGLRFSLGDDETDLAQLVIEDNDDLLPNNKLSGGVKYFISLGFGETTIYEDLFVGYGDLLDVQATETNVIYKVVTIFGSSIYEQWRYLNYVRVAKLSELDDPSTISDPNFKAYNHMIRAVSKSNELLYDKLIIDQQLGWDLESISKKVDTIIGGINLGRINFADFCRFLKSITGASSGVRLRNGKEEFFFEYPTDNYIPILLKSGIEKGSADQAHITSYCYAPFTKTTDTTIDVRHCTVLHGITELTDQFISGSKDFIGADTLTFQALCQYLPLPADAKRIKQLNLMLSMRGEVTSPQNKVNGALYLPDSAGNPKGEKLDAFEIPLSDIEDTPSIVSVAVDVDPNDIKGNTDIVVKLYQRSGTAEIDKGEPNHDNANTILWYHNNKVNVTGQYKSGVAQEGDRHKEPNLQWTVRSTGPQYAVSIFSDIKRIQTVMSPELFPTYGVREQIIDVSDLRDKTTIINYMHYLAYILATPKSYINSIKIKIPNNFFYRPNQIMFMNVTRPHIAEQMRIKRVEYNLTALPDQVGFNQSSRICTVTLLGIFNPADSVIFNCDL